MQVSTEIFQQTPSQFHHNHPNHHHHSSDGHYNEDNQRLEPHDKAINSCSSSGSSSDNDDDDHHHNGSANKENHLEPLPDPNQVAGHMFSDGKRGNLANKECIYKYCGEDPRALAEVSFYHRLKDEKEFTPLHPYVCKFFGLQDVRISNDGYHKYIALENLTSSYQRLNQMDVKLGRQSWIETAPAHVAARRAKKEINSTTPKIGFRICGMHCFDDETRQVVKYDRKWGMGLTLENITQALGLFFRSGNKKKFYPHLIPRFIQRIEGIKAFFESQHIVRFYASSLFFLWESDPTADEFATKMDLRLIDFSHTCDIKDGGRDEGVLFGLVNLLSCLREIERESKLCKRSDSKDS